MGVVVVELLEICEARCDLPPARSGVVARELEQREGAIEAVGRSAITGPLCDVQQVGYLPARLLDLPSIGSDLSQDHPKERFDHTPTGLPRNVHRLVPQSRSPLP